MVAFIFATAIAFANISENQEIFNNDVVTTEKVTNLESFDIQNLDEVDALKKVAVAPKDIVIIIIDDDSITIIVIR